MALLDPNPVYKPFRYPWAYDAWLTQQRVHWLPEETVRRTVKRAPIWIVGAVCAGLLLALFLLLELRLRAEMKAVTGLKAATSMEEPF